MEQKHNYKQQFRLNLDGMLVTELFPCPECNKVYSRKDAMKRHNKKHKIGAQQDPKVALDNDGVDEMEVE